MSQIVFRPSLVNEANDKLSAKTSKLSSEKSEFLTTCVRMDSKVLARQNLSGRLSEANRDFNEIETRMKELNKFIDFAEKEYFKAENKIKVLEAELLDRLQINPIISENINKEKKNGHNEFGIEFNWKAAFDSEEDWAARGGDALGFLGVSRLVHKGFKIERYETNNKETRYRIKNPKVIGIPPSKKGRKDKLYSAKDIRELAKNGTPPKVAKYLHPGTGAVKALGSKAGWLGVAAETVKNLRSNLNPEDGKIKAEKVVGDAVVDVGLGAVSIAAGGALSAAAVTAGAPVIVGAAVAVGVSLAASYIFGGIEIGKGNNKDTLGNHLKKGAEKVGKGVKKGLKTVAGWFK